MGKPPTSNTTKKGTSKDPVSSAKATRKDEKNSKNKKKESSDKVEAHSAS